MTQKKKHLLIAFGGLLLALVLSFAVSYFMQPQRHESSGKTESSKQTQTKLKDLPKGVSSSDWDLVLVNKWNKRDKEINFDKTQVSGIAMDTRIKQALLDFQSGARAAGYQTQLISGYRSIQYQKEVFAGVKQNNMAEGMSDAEAEKKTAEVVQYPGSSEHQTGLAVDLAGRDAFEKYPNLEAEMDTFASQKWLIDHAADYGFILRYPNDKEQIKQTGIDYESWHFRYVGVKNAQYMKKHNLTLEAYIAGLKADGR
ncbi:M15 family metallopeptidase [Fructobacillus sp. M2-14]|uniref:M15 family metallopeptidase n=1 Tax=Fructobacillus broussonetiae TaxID=2713173 RepID=A0ABS5R0V9_9LACO|nr:M15 family metallopeptidase [Fructobacillus broussonetiae]MBS9338642.1 M15 family metallopeptidase [Fructobacillus broussonetiae]